MKRLYEFSALVSKNIVIAADSEAEARASIDSMGEIGWNDAGDAMRDG